jgi:hypothetical protein
MSLDEKNAVAMDVIIGGINTDTTDKMIYAYRKGLLYDVK